MARNMHRKALLRIGFFKNKDRSFISTVAPLLTHSLAVEGHFIYTKRDPSTEIYFISDGRVGFVTKDKETGNYTENYKSIPEGSYFGDTEVFMMIPRKYTVKAVIDTQLLIMNKTLLNIVKTEYPGIADEMKELAYSRDKGNLQALCKWKAFKQLETQPALGALATLEEREELLEATIIQYGGEEEKNIFLERELSNQTIYSEVGKVKQNVGLMLEDALSGLSEAEELLKLASELLTKSAATKDLTSTETH